jgi:ketosteroid isomerase-like protein
MSQSNVAAAKRIYESRNRGDLDGVLVECEPDVRGHDEVRAYLESLQEDWETFRHEPERFMDAGDKVVERGRCSEFVSYYDRSEALRSAGLAE